MPLGVVYTKSTSIWDDIVPFVESLMGAYKKSQQTKWDNEWQLSMIADIEKANKASEVKGFLEMQKIPEENLDIKGMEKFATEAMGLLAQKEMVMNPEDFKPDDFKFDGITPEQQVAPIKTGTKLMPDVKEFNNLYKFVSELPTGKVDWSNTMNLFKKKLESGREMGNAAQQFLQMIVGQSMPTDERQKVQKDFDFAKDIHATLYPGEAKPTSDYERWEKDPEKFEAFKRVGKDPKMIFDWESFIKDNPDWQVKTINAKGDVTLGRKDTTKKWTFDTWEEAVTWTKSHPQEGFDWRVDKEKEGFDVTAVKKDKPTGGTTKLVPTYQTISTINQDLMNPGLDYDTTMHNAQVKYNLGNVKLASKADQAKRAYDMFEGIITHEDNEYIDEKGMVKEEEAYTDYYKDYEKFAEVYFRETGEILPKKFLSIEEAGVYETNQWALGKAKGGAKPIRNEEGIPWSWQKDTDATKELYNEMQRNGLKPEDYDLKSLAQEQGIDIERLLKMFE